MPYAFQAPNGKPLEAGFTAQPPSSSGLGRCPFKAVARVRIPLGVRGSRNDYGHDESRCQGPVAQLVSAPPCHGGGRGFKSRRGRCAGRIHESGTGPFCWPGSSVGTSVRLKSGRSPVRSRPWPPRLCRSEGNKPSGLLPSPKELQVHFGPCSLRPGRTSRGNRPVGDPPRRVRIRF